jgi:hypothetical protein
MAKTTTTTTSAPKGAAQSATTTETAAQTVARLEKQLATLQSRKQTQKVMDTIEELEPELAAAKKAAKKAAKATTPTTPAQPKAANGMAPNKVKVLTLLAKTPAGMTRTEMSEATGIVKGWTKMLGAVTLGAPATGTLEGDGLVRSEEVEDQRGRVYTITPAGKKALAAAQA